MIYVVFFITILCVLFPPLMGAWATVVILRQTRERSNRRLVRLSLWLGCLVWVAAGLRALTFCAALFLDRPQLGYSTGLGRLYYSVFTSICFGLPIGGLMVLPFDTSRGLRITLLGLAKWLAIIIAYPLAAWGLEEWLDYKGVRDQRERDRRSQAAYEAEHPDEFARERAWDAAIAEEQRIKAPWNEKRISVSVIENGEVAGLQFESRREADLSMLRDAPRLRRLVLNECQITESELRQLAKTPRLQVLALDNTDISDAGLALLPDLPELVELYMSQNPRLTDACVNSLARFPSLTKLYVFETGITAAALLPLQIARPNLQVIGGYGETSSRNEWTKHDWRRVERILGEEAFQKALRNAGLNGIPEDIPEEPLVLDLDAPVETVPVEDPAYHP